MNYNKKVSSQTAVRTARALMSVLIGSLPLLFSVAADAAATATKTAASAALRQSTYFGGDVDEIITAIAVHPATGEVVVAGHTTSPDLPCTVAGGGCNTGAQPAKAQGTDGFVARFNASLTQVLQVTYVGGSGDDQINALAIDPVTGNIFVAGQTSSIDLPCTAAGTGCGNAAQGHNAGGFDGFVAKLNPQLTRLLQVTYLGGTESDQINALAFHPSTGEVLAAGSTGSTDLPCTGQGDGCGPAAQVRIAGGEDGFVARLSSDLTALRRTTYFGGTSTDRIFALAVHPFSGEVLVAGSTQSNDLQCTTLAGLCGRGAQGTIGGGQDGFVARLSPNLNRVLQATYLGGTGSDLVFALTVHPLSGEILAAGAVSGNNFPCTTTGGGCAAGAQNHLAGGQDGFVARLNANLTTLLQATFLGGTGFDQIYAIAVHPASGEIVVAGQSASNDLPCTMAAARCGNGAQSSNDGSFAGFVARLDASLTALLQSSYVGGTGVDALTAIAVHPLSGDVLAGGFTTSTDVPCTIADATCDNAAQSQFAGGLLDALVTRLNIDLTATGATPAPIVFAPQNGAPLSSLRISAPAQVTGISGAVPVYVEGQLGSAYCISSANQCSCDVSGGFVSERGSIANNQFVCVRHVSAPIADEITRTVFHAGGGAGTFRVATGAPLGQGGGCSLDVDGNNALDALTDGVMLVRAMFGLTGTAVTNGAIGGSAARSDWTSIRAYLNGNCGTTFAP